MVKIYVHHNYSHERFWYFFHGVDVDLNDVVTHTNLKNALNKKVPITDKVNIKCKYKNTDLDITFVSNENWDLDGHHILDYSIDLYDRKLVSDRGFNSNIRKLVDTEYIPLLNSKAKFKNTKYHFVYIDWEGHNPYYEHKMHINLNHNINLYVDEIDDDISHKHFVFTNTFMSFIYPDTLGLKNFIHFADILKYKNDFKHKLNFPIRRFYRNKLKLFNKIMNLENRNINITHSSFHDTSHYAGFENTEYRNKLIDKIGTDNFIKKRGHGIHDWGGEWNDNNLKEFMWKLLGVSDVNIIPEYDPWESENHGDYSYDTRMIGKSYITEKSVSHILASKPFIPLSYATIEFYENILKQYGYDVIEYPLKYKDLIDIIEDLNTQISDDLKWNSLKLELTNWISHVRTCLFDIVNTNNSLLDNLLTSNVVKKPINII